ncbi:MAG: IS1634 family transposase, partial [Thermoplasmata archaeon]
NALYDRLMERGDKLDEIIAYDLTSTYFHGTKCPIAYIGYSRDRVSGKKQIEIAIVGAKKNRYPLFHRVYAGDVLDLKTVGRFLAELNRYKIKSKWILWDAGMVSEETLRWADEQEYGIICGLKASMEAYNEIIEKSGEIETAENYMKKEGNGALYVKDFEYPIFGKERYVTVILNTDLMMRTRVERNESIREALKALGDLKLTGNKKEDLKKINVIIKDINRYISVKIKDEKIVTEFNEKELMKEENRDGKRIVMSTKLGLSGREIVETYFSKDFIEKIFRSLKSDIEIRPIRHRIPERVRAYVFVCVTAYRLKVELEKRFEDQKVEMGVDEFLEKMGEVEKVKIELGKENKIRYLNMNRDLLSILKKIRMGSLLK